MKPHRYRYYPNPVILRHPNPVILRLDRGIHLPFLFDHSCLTKLFDLLNGSPGQARG
jgi:hypothetical protein